MHNVGIHIFIFAVNQKRGFLLGVSHGLVNFATRRRIIGAAALTTTPIMRRRVAKYSPVDRGAFPSQYALNAEVVLRAVSSQKANRNDQ